MRVLLATDGSTSAETAGNLVGSLTWPEATVIRIVAVVESKSVALPAVTDDDHAIATALERRLTDAAAALAAPGRFVETLVQHGRPASAIVEQAAEIRADLIVVGSRGLGSIRSMLLGSVSAEVVDRAPCPVLVARASSVGQVLVAVDGSRSARRAVEFLAGATYLSGHRLHVLSVGRTLYDGLPYWAVNSSGSKLPANQSRLEEDRLHTEASAAQAAEELSRRGHDVRWTIGAGDAAHEIIEASSNLSCDLIVMGSRGLTGLDRLWLGSVARNVLLHAAASVLIVREPVREHQPERPLTAATSTALATVG